MDIVQQIFKKVLSLAAPGHGVRNYDRYSIYKVSNYTDSKIVYRVDCGEVGSYEIIKETESEIYNTKLHEWVYVPCEHYIFSCMSQNFNGYPLINPVNALAILNGTYQHN